MPAKKILFLGFGDLAARTCALLPDAYLVGVARSPKAMPPGVVFWQGAADSVAILAKLAQESFDVVVITLTPTEYSDKAYQVAYVDTVKALVRSWQQGGAPGLIIFVSSTSVYEQHQGEEINEDSPATPSGFAGQRLLQAEQTLQASGLPVCILRCAGIYGPGRDFLIRQVKAGQGGNDDYTNRIHADDCAGILRFLMQRHWSEPQTSAQVYLGCDSQPATSNEVRRWLAVKMGIQPNNLKPSDSLRGGNKRCSNQKLLAAGYLFKYPTYREGYGALLSPTSVVGGAEV